MSPGSGADAARFWDGLHRRFGGDGTVGAPNRFLVETAADLTPGRALDLGSGRGADTVWLAAQGWQVVGVDISTVAVDRLRTAAAAAGLADRVDVRSADLPDDFPDGTFDLVSAQFLHSPLAAHDGRPGTLRRAAGAVAPGGRLLVVSHHGMPDWHTGLPDDLTDAPLDPRLPTPQQTRAAVDLEPGRWSVERDELVDTVVSDGQGRTGVRTDHVLLARRRPTVGPDPR